MSALALFNPVSTASSKSCFLDVATVDNSALISLCCTFKPEEISANFVDNLLSVYASVSALIL